MNKVYIQKIKEFIFRCTDLTYENTFCYQKIKPLEKQSHIAIQGQTI